MIYVSIPVHEKLAVIANQANNFKQFFPEAMIVFHVSKTAEFSPSELEDYLQSQKIANTLVNPVQTETKWGSIIQAHFQNILYIIERGDAQKVVFHSSNDMLVRKGVYDYLSTKNNIFHHRNVVRNSYWWVSNVASNDVKLLDWLAIHGGGAIVASQIEGSMYHIDFLKELTDEVLKYHPILESDLFYPREEIIFSSFAVAKGIKSDGLPYIFSEVHRFDKVLWQYFDKYSLVINDNNKFSRKLKKRVNDKLFESGFYKIQQADIEAIRQQNGKYLANTQTLSDGGNVWEVHQVHNLYGVKRVERTLDDPIRQYISGLSA